MSRSYSFYVCGEPKAQARPRAFAFNKGGKTQVRVYDPATAEFWKGEIAKAAREAGVELIDGPVSLELFFSFPRPKSHFRANGMLKESAPRHHVQKPDVDNTTKAVCDALTTIGAWHDDRQIIRLAVDKSWALGSSQGGCSITVTELNYESAP